MAAGVLGDKKIGFIGCGAMARALAGGLVESGVAPDHIHASDPFAEARSAFEKAIGAKPVEDNAAVVSASDIVVVAVKPGVVATILQELDPKLAATPLWISIAAGIPLSQLAGALPDSARIVRTMPNTPALVGAGATAYYPGPGVDDGVIPGIITCLRPVLWTS